MFFSYLSYVQYSVGIIVRPIAMPPEHIFLGIKFHHNMTNGFGEILKLSLVQLVDMFGLLNNHRSGLVGRCFGYSPDVPSNVGECITNLSVWIVLYELGPSLWDKKLDSCVYYGHTS